MFYNIYSSILTVISVPKQFLSNFIIFLNQYYSYHLDHLDHLNKSRNAF